MEILLHSRIDTDTGWRCVCKKSFSSSLSSEWSGSFHQGVAEIHFLLNLNIHFVKFQKKSQRNSTWIIYNKLFPLFLCALLQFPLLPICRDKFDYFSPHSIDKIREKFSFVIIKRRVFLPNSERGGGILLLL